MKTLSQPPGLTVDNVRQVLIREVVLSRRIKGDDLREDYFGRVHSSHSINVIEQ